MNDLLTILKEVQLVTDFRRFFKSSSANMITATGITIPVFITLLSDLFLVSVASPVPNKYLLIYVIPLEQCVVNAAEGDREPIANLTLIRYIEERI